ncbi:MAG: hypothetical protein R2713_15765 [Ilumatobacteraceae bacterium]
MQRPAVAVPSGPGTIAAGAVVVGTAVVVAVVVVVVVARIVVVDAGAAGAAIGAAATCDAAGEDGASALPGADHEGTGGERQVREPASSTSPRGPADGGRGGWAVGWWTVMGLMGRLL